MNFYTQETKQWYYKKQRSILYKDGSLSHLKIETIWANSGDSMEQTLVSFNDQTIDNVDKVIYTWTTQRWIEDITI